MDVRIAKRFDFKERIKLHAYLESFNLFIETIPPRWMGFPRHVLTQLLPNLRRFCGCFQDAKASGS